MTRFVAHPYADKFPMLPEPELAELAESMYRQPAAEVPRHRQEKELRREIDVLCGRVAFRCYDGPESKQEVSYDLNRIFNKRRHKLTIPELEGAKELLQESLSTGQRLWPRAS